MSSNVYNATLKLRQLFGHIQNECHYCGNYTLSKNEMNKTIQSDKSIAQDLQLEDAINFSRPEEYCRPNNIE